MSTSDAKFEQQRGISSIQIRDGYTRVHVSDLKGPIEVSRLRVLDAIARANVSIDFLKLTPGGLAFVAPEAAEEAVRQCLADLDERAAMDSNRSVLLVSAVNMRDEEGLIAQIVARCVQSGIEIDHLADMHDGVLIVCAREDAPALRLDLANSFGLERA